VSVCESVCVCLCLCLCVCVCEREREVEDESKAGPIDWLSLSCTADESLGTRLCLAAAAEACLCRDSCHCVLSEFGRGPEAPADRPASLFPVPVTLPVHSFHTLFEGRYLHTEPKGKGLQEETKSMRHYSQQLSWEHIHNSVLWIAF
jgi:hypothetical protein